jgi:vesicle transport protein SEC22
LFFVSTNKNVWGRKDNLTLYTIFVLSFQWRLQVDQAARPFQFIHYDPIIQRKQREYRDQSTAGNSHKSKLTEDLTEIHSIMRKNIDEILNRGEKLDQVSNISQELRSKSKDFKWGTKKLTWQARVQQYGPIVIGAVIVLTVLYVKIFHIGF